MIRGTGVLDERTAAALQGRGFLTDRFLHGDSSLVGKGATTKSSAKMPCRWT
jgi:hypothetical protein